MKYAIVQTTVIVDSRNEFEEQDNELCREGPLWKYSACCRTSPWCCLPSSAPATQDGELRPAAAQHQPSFRKEKLLREVK